MKNSLRSAAEALARKRQKMKGSASCIIHYASCIIIFAISFFFSSCNKHISKQNTNKTVILYPPPPNQAHIQYLTRISTSTDLGEKQSSFSKMLIGTKKPKRMVKPYGLAIYKGKLFVCDNYAGGMDILDLEKKTFDFFWPVGKGQLKIPINCFVDEKGYLYVADVGRKEIVIFDENRNYVRSFGDTAKYKPSDVNVYDNKIFVANSANSIINVYSNDSTNKLLYTIPKSPEDLKGVLCMPVNIAINKDKIYVADFGCSKIKIFSTDGTFVDTIGDRGDRPGLFSKLKGIAVDSEANVFAVDAAFENVQMFNKDNNLLMDFGGHYKGPGDLVLPAKIVVDYDNLKYFQKYVDPAYDLKYLIFVTSQYGLDLINIYGRIEPKKKK